MAVMDRDYMKRPLPKEPDDDDGPPSWSELVDLARRRLREWVESPLADPERVAGAVESLLRLQQCASNARILDSIESDWGDDEEDGD